jgi:hypothetical protein
MPGYDVGSQVAVGPTPLMSLQFAAPVEGPVQTHVALFTAEHAPLPLPPQSAPAFNTGGMLQALKTPFTHVRVAPWLHCAALPQLTTVPF